MPRKLRPVKGLCCMDLPRESGTQRAGPQQPDVGLGVNIQRIVPDVREQPGPEIKERTVVESLAPAEDSDVVEVPVLVAEQHVRFEQQGQVGAKPLQAGEPDGTGNVFELKVIVPEGISVSTADAYRGIVPSVPETSLQEVLSMPVESWKETLTMDVESTVFAKYPQLEALKRSRYESGAVYASMSGSGSALFALYRK